MKRKGGYIGYILARFFIVIALLLLTVVVAIQIPPVQTWLVNTVADKLEEHLQADIRIGRIEFVPTSGLCIKDIVVIDKNPYREDVNCKGYEAQDTFATINSLRVTFKPSGLLGALNGNPVRMRRVTVDGGSMALVIEPSDKPQGLANLNRIFGLEPPEEKKEPSPNEIFSIQKVVVNNFRFRMINFANPRPRKGNAGINWEDMDAIADVKAHDMCFKDGRMHGVAERIEIREKSGFHARNISGSVRVGRGETVIDDLLIIDDFSSISLPNFRMSYSDGFKDFINEVGIHTDFARSLVAFQTIKFFAGESLYKNFCLLDISGGRVDGPVSNMDVKGLRFNDRLSGMRGVISHCKIKGLPNIQETVFDFNTDGIDFSPRSLGVFVSNFSKGKPLVLPSIIPEKQYTLKGAGLGTLNGMDLGIGLHSELGLIGVQGRMANIISPLPIEIGGEVTTPDFETGIFINSEKLGKADLSTLVNLKIENGAQIFIDSLRINSLETEWHEFHDISGSASIQNGRIEARLAMDDSGLKGNLEAAIDGGRYSLKGALDKAELMNFGVVKDSYVISTDIDADISSIKADDIRGYVDLDNFHFTNEVASHDVGRISVKAGNADNCQTISFDSSFADAAVSGRLEDFKAYLKVHDRKQIFNSIIPDIFISDETSIELSRTDTVNVNARIFSPRLAYGNINAKDLLLTVDAGNELFKLNLGSSSLGFSSQTNLENPEIHLETICHKAGEDGIRIVSRDSSSHIAFGPQRWTFGDVDVTTAGGDVRIDDFSLCNGLQKILIGGNLKDSLRLSLENIGGPAILDVMEVDEKTAGIIRDSAGIANGYVDYIAPKGLVRASLNTVSLQDTTLSLGGLVDLKQKYLDAKADIQGINLAIATPFLQDIFTEMNGTIRGNFKAKGKFNDLYVSSDSLILDKARMKLAVTQTAYTLNGGIVLDSGKVKVGGLTIKDDFGGEGQLQGSLDMSNLKNMNLDAEMMFKDLRVISLEEESIDSFYGKINASGEAAVRGPLNSLTILASAQTSGKGDIHIPLGGGANASSGKILTFVPKHEDVDAYEAIKARKAEQEKKKKGGIDIKAFLKVNPELTGYVEINKSQGHVLKVSGNGDLSMELDSRKGNMVLGGDFNIAQGDYHFVALETVAQRNFTIEPGSAIHLKGKPLDTEFDITACYKLKASLAPLTMDTTSVSSRRLVNCKLQMKNTIANPQLGFAIEIPDLDPTTSSAVQSMLNTEEKVQKQFVALLVTGTFIPGEESGVSNDTGSAFVYNSISTFVSGQLNTILQSLNIPIDMGLNYQNSQGKDLFDVAVSTQLFDNKVVVNGSVGNRQNSNGKSGDVVGDIDIEVKLNKQGNIRVKAFSHSADDYTNFLDNTQRNGIGFSFQTEFGKAKLEKKFKPLPLDE